MVMQLTDITALNEEPFMINGPKVVGGRADECQIWLDEEPDEEGKVYVSKKHFFIEDGNGKHMIYDTSRNGTWVNGKRLERGKGVVLKVGDTIDLAKRPDLTYAYQLKVGESK